MSINTLSISRVILGANVKEKKLLGEEVQRAEVFHPGDRRLCSV